ncbi:hypothetical protein QR680_000712 [Steinernema hermaphroditum]|uniref:Chitin-binding type-2 domain-containing protein n=1 Tax=Steinernema hermaphroditum TaxID=289476 RepID=A0AA39GYE2_9BILA|nr:hypothetical protein QR680_000712 [Steinernema hermaphroditum]
MPVPVGFRVVHVSGLDDYDISRDLLVTKEWVSEKYSEYPRNLIVRLDRQSNVERIQILCHRIFIPSKVDLYYSNEDIHQDVEKVNFQSLGEVVFKDRREDIGKHELKTIYIESDVTFLKFQVGQNYDNPKTNPFDQVGLVNIAIIGRPVPTGQTAVLGDSLKQETKLMKGMSLLQRYNTTDVKRDDYPSDMLDLLVVIEKNKEVAVKNENYPLATKCKKAAKDLSSAMTVLKEKENEKRTAVEKEDYDQAEVLTKEIQNLRTTTLKKIDPKVLEEHSVINNTLIPPSRDSPRDTPTPKPLFERITLTPSPPRSREKKRKYTLDDSVISREFTPPPSVTPTPATRPSSRNRLPRSSSISTMTSSSSSNKFMQKENTVVPGAANRRRRSITSSASFDSGQMDEETLFAQINPNDQTYAKKLKSVFGLEMVFNVYSKNWEHRRSALIDTHKKLSAVSPDKASSYLSVAMPILVKGLRDKLYNVYSEALNLLQYIVITYIPNHKLQKTFGQKIVDKTYHILVSRTGDTISDSRFGTQTYDAIGVLLSGDPQITKLYITRFMEPFDLSGSVRSDQGKATIVNKAIQQLGAPNKSVNLTEATICKFANNCMRHSDPEIRNMGKSLVITIYRNGNREEIRSHLPSPKSSLARSHLMRALFAELDSMDRSSTHSSSNSSTSSKRSSVDGTKPPKSVRLVLDRSRHPSDEDPVDYEKLCMYCGLLSPELDKDGLQEHYERHCPMLFKCPHCIEVDEVCHMKEHYVAKCKKKELYKECPKCNQPIERRMYKRHVDDENCQMPKGDVGRCLLCQSDVAPNNDVGWRKHLMKQCIMNNRRKTVLNLWSSTFGPRTANSIGRCFQIEILFENIVCLRISRPQQWMILKLLAFAALVPLFLAKDPPIRPKPTPEPYSKKIREADCSQHGDGAFVFGCSSEYFVCRSYGQGYVKSVFRCPEGHKGRLKINPANDRCESAADISVCKKMTNENDVLEISQPKHFSCRGRDDGYYAVENCGQEYAQCQSGRLRLLLCGSRQLYYDPDIQRCQHKSNCEKNKDAGQQAIESRKSEKASYEVLPLNICKNKEGQLINRGKCSGTFWRCTKNEPVNFYCPYGLVFSEKLQLCTFNVNAPECNGNSPISTSNHDEHPKPMQLEVNCTGLRNGFHEIFACYRDYVQCSNDQSLILSCPKDLVFNDKTNKCDYFENCRMQKKPKKGNDVVVELDSFTPWIVRRTEPFSCAGKEEGEHELQPCIRNYITCDKNESATLHMCENEHVRQSGKCILTSDCEPAQKRMEQLTNTNCEDREDGFYEDGKCLPYFIHCANQILHKIKCQPGLFFLEDRCVWKSVCENPPPPMPSTKPIPKVHTHVDIPENFACKGQTGEVAIGRCLNHYIICSNDIPHVVKCPSILRYSTNGQRCMWEKDCLVKDPPQVNRMPTYHPPTVNATTVGPVVFPEQLPVANDTEQIISRSGSDADYPPAVKTQKAPESFNCIGKSDGDYQVQMCGRSYVSCEKEAATSKLCSEDAVFEGTECVPNTTCSTTSETTTESAIRSKRAAIYPPGSMIPDETVAPPMAVQANGYKPPHVPDYVCPSDGWFTEGNCLNFYIQCSNTYAYRFKCASTLVWSGNACIWPRDCENTPKEELDKHLHPQIQPTETKEVIKNKCVDKKSGLYASVECGVDYYECVEGIMVMKNCLDGKVFNPAAKKCAEPESVPSCEQLARQAPVRQLSNPAMISEPTVDCSEKPSGFYEVDGCRHFFFYCENGAATKHFCPEGLFYDHETERCHVKGHVPRCGGARPADDHSFEPDEPVAQIDPHCQKKPDGFLYGLSGCRRSYFRCNGKGRSLKISCAANLYFDLDAKSCGQKEHLPCCGGKRPVITPEPVNPFCQGKTDGYHDAGGCQTFYYSCVSGVAERVNCPKKLYYDPEISTCDLKYHIPICGGKRHSDELPVEPIDTFCKGRIEGYHASDVCSSVYYFCSSGATQKLHCKPGLFYDADDAICKYKEVIPSCGGSPPTQPAPKDPAPVPQDTFCEGKPDGIHTSNSCSDFFYSCKADFGTKIFCPAGLFFDRELEKCDQKHLIPSCGGIRPTQPPVKSTSPPVPRDPFCDDKSDGFHLTDSCTTFFYYCSSGVASKMSCPSGLYYDQEVELCAARSHVPACGGVRPTQAPTSAPLPHDPFCDGKPDGVQIPRTCSNHFYHCSRGSSNKVECPNGLFYDSEIDVCDQKENVPGCGGTRPSRPTPTDPAPRDPYCDGKSDGFHLPTACTNYFYLCNRGTSNKMECPSGLYYDSDIEVCDQKHHVPACGGIRPPPLEPSPAPPHDPYCESKPDGVHLPKSCTNHFYHCSRGTSNKMECPNGLFYDSEIDVCDQREHVPSCGGTRPSRPPPTEPVPRDPFCDGKLDGIHLPDSCTSVFYQCTFGHADKLRCPDGLYYDREIDLCDQKAHVPACGGMRPPRPTPTEPSRPVPRDPFCDGKRNGIYLTDRCTTFYYDCNGGVTHKMECPSGLYYDKEANLCEQKHHVPGCGGTRPTQPPPKDPAPRDPYCDGKRDGLYVPQSCTTFFYHCNGGASNKMDCPSGLYYDSEINLCDKRSHVPACGGTRPTRPPPTIPPTSRDPFCDRKPDGIHLPQSCTNYFYECSRGVPKKMKCGNGLFYDRDIAACAQKTHVPGCGGVRPTRPPPVTPPPQVPFCQNRPNGLYPANQCVNFFYKCDNRVSFKMFCTATLFFDPELKHCLPKQTIPACGGTRPPPVQVPQDPQVDQFCRGKVEGTYDALGCNSFYYICSRQGNRKIVCPSGFFRDHELGICEAKAYVPNCGGTRRTAPPAQNFCSGRANGLYPAQECASVYNHCHAGKLVLMQCSPGLFYDIELKSCHPKHLTPNCGGRRQLQNQHPPQNPPPAVQLPTEVDIDQPPKPTLPPRKLPKFDCIGKSNGDYSAGCSDVYFSCVGPIHYVRFCPENTGLKYSQEMGRCDYVANVPECGGKIPDAAKPTGPSVPSNGQLPRGGNRSPPQNHPVQPERPVERPNPPLQLPTQAPQPPVQLPTQTPQPLVKLPTQTPQPPVQLLTRAPQPPVQQPEPTVAVPPQSPQQPVEPSVAQPQPQNPSQPQPPAEPLKSSEPPVKSPAQPAVPNPAQPALPNPAQLAASNPAQPVVPNPAQPTVSNPVQTAVATQPPTRPSEPALPPSPPSKCTGKKAGLYAVGACDRAYFSCQISAQNGQVTESSFKCLADEAYDESRHKCAKKHLIAYCPEYRPIQTNQPYGK